MLLVDPRGMGKTSPRAESARNPSLFGRDWKDAYIALAIGRPLLGQRVADLLSVLEGLAAESGDRKHKGFHLVGIGAAGPVVLHAALLDEHGLIKQVTVEQSLISWADVVDAASVAIRWETWCRVCCKRTTCPTWRPGWRQFH